MRIRLAPRSRCGPYRRNRLAGRFELKGALWDLIGTLNDNFNNLGFVIIGVFIFAWLASFAIYRAKGYDELPVRAAEQ
nr:hypothetical protein [Trinickia symbiotica]